MAEKKLSILVEIKDAASNVLGNLMGMFDKLISSGGVLTTVLGGLFGGAILAAGSKLVEMFASEEQTIVRLNAALRVTGIYSVEATTQIQNMAQRMQEQTTTSREEAINISARFAALAHDLTAEQLAEAQKMVIGYAAATGKSVDEATALMVRAVTTHVTHVRGLNVELDANANQQKRFQEIQGATNKLFEIASASAQTLGGHIKQAQHEFGDLERVLGQVIVESLGLNDKSSGLRDLIKDLTEKVRDNLGEWIKWGRVVFDAVFGLGKLTFDVVKLVIQPLLDALIGGFKVVGDLIGNVSAAIVLLFHGQFRAAWEATKQIARDFSGDVQDTMKKSATDTINNLKTLASDALGVVKKFRDDVTATAVAPAASGRPSTAGEGANIGAGGGEFDPGQFAREMQQAFQVAKELFAAGQISAADYHKELARIRQEIMEHIALVPKMSTAYLELIKVLAGIKGTGALDLIKEQSKAIGEDMAKAISTSILAHQNFGETVKKEVGKAAAEYAKLDFAHALEEVAAALAAVFFNPGAAATHWAAAAQYAAAGAEMAAIGGATGGFSGAGAGGGGAAGAAAQAQAVSGLANGITIIIPPGHTSSQAWMDEFVGLNEQAGQRRITVQPSAA